MLAILANTTSTVSEKANLKITEKYQEFDPFKLILYSAEAGQKTLLMRRP